VKKKSSQRGAKARKSKRPRVDIERRWFRHPLYGEVPRIRHTAVGANGRTYEWWQCDPTFKPRLPARAVEGDIEEAIAAARRAAKLWPEGSGCSFMGGHCSRQSRPAG
jgi:hypothetical protein